ncbi:hypothetical protein HZB02_03285 [Candidatus Woesearchaeota archaeon]|nr:hypothetical protein [Candidatus Woesearchaeota archaeon]
MVTQTDERLHTFRIYDVCMEYNSWRERLVEARSQTQMWKDVCLEHEVESMYQTASEYASRLRSIHQELLQKESSGTYDPLTYFKPEEISELDGLFSHLSMKGLPSDALWTNRDRWRNSTEDLVWWATSSSHYYQKKGDLWLQYSNRKRGGLLIGAGVALSGILGTFGALDTPILSYNIPDLLNLGLFVASVFSIAIGLKETMGQKYKNPLPKIADILEERSSYVKVTLHSKNIPKGSNPYYFLSQCTGF